MLYVSRVLPVKSSKSKVFPGKFVTIGMKIDFGNEP